MEKCAVIVAGGPVEDQLVKTWIENNVYDCLIAADRGMEVLDRIGVYPNFILGDFDSVQKDVLEKWKQDEHVTFETFPERKDETDTEIAIRRAGELGYQRLVIFGALGGRVDHLMGNIHLLLYGKQRGMQVLLLDEKNRIRLLHNETFVLRKDEQYGKYVSFLPFGGETGTITLDGFRYSLTKGHLQFGSTQGISNVIEAEEASVEVEAGMLLMLETRD